METTMYDVLLQLPLFQGLGKADMTNILTKVKFHFVNYKAGERIIVKNTPCRMLVFLLSGKVTAETEYEKEKYTFSEVFSAPCLIEPYAMFGLNQHFVSTYIAKTEVSVITIDKPFFSAELNRYEAFRINYVNMLSYNVQQLQKRIGHFPCGSTAKRITDFLLMLSSSPRGEKSLRVKMEDLAFLLNSTRNKVSQALNYMQDEKLINLQRMGFTVFDLEELKNRMNTIESDENS